MDFWQFSKDPDIHDVPGKLLELRSDVQFFSNLGENVMISAEVSCNQDLRVGRKYDIFIPELLQVVFL